MKWKINKLKPGYANYIISAPNSSFVYGIWVIIFFIIKGKTQFLSTAEKQYKYEKNLLSNTLR